MSNHCKNIIWPNSYPNPNCTLCTNNAILHVATFTFYIMKPTLKRIGHITLQ